MTTSGTIDALYVAKRSAAPMEAVETAHLVAGKGIRGDRYMARQGTYSANFLNEPGRHLTMVSADGFDAAVKRNQVSIARIALRRNVWIKGLDSAALNDMVGHEVQLGQKCRLFVHRRNVPCKYREAETKCANFMNNFWEDCGVCCEILVNGEIRPGDAVAVIPNTFQPRRCRVGLKPPGFFKKPADRSLLEVKGSIIPIPIAIVFCLLDPDGFERVEYGYNSVGQHFFSPRAYRVGMFVKTYLRTPLLISGVALAAVAVRWWGGSS